MIIKSGGLQIPRNGRLYTEQGTLTIALMFNWDQVKNIILEIKD